MERQNYTKRQTEALELLKKHYPSGVGVADRGARAVFDSLIARGAGLVERLDSDETPTGDCYWLTDAGLRRSARMLRKGAASGAELTPSMTCRTRGSPPGGCGEARRQRRTPIRTLERPPRHVFFGRASGKRPAGSAPPGRGDG